MRPRQQSMLPGLISTLLFALSASSLWLPSHHLGFVTSAMAAPNDRNLLTSLASLHSSTSSAATQSSSYTHTILLTDPEDSSPEDSASFSPQPYAFSPRPLLDSRKYRLLKLSNGLEVLLVSDPSTSVEAASVHVKAGHFQDPPTRPGLAHFHEHMLFLGTERYPGEDEYEAYLAKNGGSSNAYTDMEVRTEQR